MKGSEVVRDSPEWSALLQCARRPPQEPSDDLFSKCDPAKLLELAEEHSVTNLLAACVLRFERPLPEGLRHAIREQQRQHAISALHLIAEMLHVTELLSSARIESLVLKGPALSLVAYGDPAVRQYGDIDLLVRHRDIYRSTELLLESGCQARISLETIAAGKVPGEYVFRRGNGALLEIHTERTLRYFPNPLRIEDLFARKLWLELNGKKFATHSLEDALLALCTHGAKHFWTRLLWVADLSAMLDRRSAQIDWDRVVACARELGTERILRTGLLLANRVLRSEIPAAVATWVRQDGPAEQMAQELAEALPGISEPSLLRRALFRMRMRGGFLRGLGYLTRLSLVPTEHDWQGAGGGRLRESSRRLLRLAGKYGRNHSQQ
jgi:hypothetical protein